MTIIRVDSLDGLKMLEPEWLDLWRACPRATPFQSPQWLLPWIEHLFEGGEIWGLAMREGDRLAGFAPFFVWGTDRRTLSFLGAGISDYGDLLFEPGREATCVSALRGFLEREARPWDLVDLRELRSGSLLLEDGQAEECSICPVLEVSSYPGSLDPKHRTDVRRARNKLLRSGGVQFTMADSGTLMRHLDEFVRLHNSRWESLDARLQCFHRKAAARFLATGNLRLSLLWMDGAAIAAMYCYTAGATLYCYLSGFNPEKAKLSPGAVLLEWTIERAASEGIEQIDFLRETESYKYLWGALDRVNYRLVSMDYNGSILRP